MVSFTSTGVIYRCMCLENRGEASSFINLKMLKINSIIPDTCNRKYKEHLYRNDV